MERSGGQAQQRGTEGQDHRREEVKIADCPQKKEQAYADLNHSASGRNAPEKKTGGGEQPEEQVGEDTEAHAVDAPSGSAKHVVEQSDANAPEKGAQQRMGLLQNGDAHPPNSREKNPPDGLGSS